MAALVSLALDELDLPTEVPYELAQSLRASLLRWYGEEHRPLPWRTQPSEYGTVVSEFMLQQTQVATVLEFYKSFLKQFPDWAALAAADEEAVLRAWSGLGYYRRARMLKRVAEVLVSGHQGRLPRDPARLAELPGFGEYTVGAVGSIALGLRLPLVDGNVRRVIGRIFGLKMDLSQGEGKRRIWAICRDLVSPERPGDFNQSLMELGATVCLPREPLCLACPAFEHCDARKKGFPEAYPAPMPRQRLLPVREVAVALTRGNKVLVLQCAEGGAFAGMWELPRLDNRDQAKAARHAAAAAAAPAPAGNGEPAPPAKPAKQKKTRSRKPELQPELTPAKVLFDLLRVRGGKPPELIGTSTATFTHHRIKTDLYRVGDKSMGAIRRQAHAAHKWVLLKNLDGLPASKAQRRLFQMLTDKKD